MIKSFKTRSLKRFWEKSDARKLPPEQVERIEMILDALDTSTEPRDMDLPGLEFHSLKGERKGQYAVKVTGNWRIVFAWEDGDAVNVEHTDYH